MKPTKRDIIWSYCAHAFSIASGILLLPLILHKLSPNEIGMNYLMLTVGSMVSLFDFGFAPQFGRNITYIFSGAQNLRKEGIDIIEGEKKQINYRLLATMIHTAKFVYRKLALFVLVLMLTVGSFYIYKVTSGFTNVHNAFIIWFVYSVSIFFNIYYTYYNSLLTGKGLITEAKKAMVYTKLAYIIMAIIFLVSGIGLLGVALANLLAPFVERYISYHYFYSKKIQTEINSFEITKKEKIELFEIIWYNAKKLGFVFIGLYAITKFSMFIAGLYLPLTVVASYGLMMQFVGIIYGISMTLFGIYNPRLSSLRVEGNKVMLLKDFAFSMGAYYLLFFILGGVLVLFGPWILSFIKANTVLPVRGIVIIYLIIMLLEGNHSCFTTLFVIGNKVPFMWIYLLTGSLIALGSYISLVYTGLGILGLVLVQGIVQLAYNNWKWPLDICKEFKISYISFLYLSISEIFNRFKTYYYNRLKHEFLSIGR